MARAWPCFGVYWLHQRPEAVLQVVLVKVIDSVVAVVPSENIDAPPIYNCGVPISWRGWLRVCHWENFGPEAVVEIKLKEVVPSVRAIVAAKDIEVVVDAY